MSFRILVWSWVITLATAATCIACVDDSKLSEAKKTPEPLPVRIAVLNFGPAQEQRSKKNTSDLLGPIIDPDDWREAARLLEKNNPSIVVVRVYSGGGDFKSIREFFDVFERDYKPKYRTVAWIDQCLLNAALAVLPIREFYFTPGAAFGWATTLKGLGAPYTQTALSDQVQLAETGALLGGRDSSIVRAFLLLDPLSADIDPITKTVTWNPHERGSLLLNREGMVMTFGADTALQTGLSRGTASNREELAALLGASAVEWVGQDAAKFLDERLEQHTADYVAIEAEYTLLLNNILLAEHSAKPKSVREYALAAYKNLRALERMAESAPRVFAWTIRDSSSLDAHRATIRRLGRWPTVSSITNEILRSKKKPAR